MDKVILVVEPQKEYVLLDSGAEPSGGLGVGGEKLERYGSVVLARPDPQALWDKKLTEKDWAKADGHYVRGGREGEWVTKRDLSDQWQIEFGGLKFYIRATSFKHTGLFPEQLANWEWMRGVLARQNDSAQNKSEGARVLNLFAYTGGATLVAAQMGAQVTHVDASKTAVAWARENAELSGLSDKPIRWIVEDVLLFVKREIKRGNKYDAIIMDPPAFGHGPKDELWKIEEDFVALVRLCEELLSDTPLFVLVSGYAAGYSALAFAYNLERFQKRFGGEIVSGDLTIQEQRSGEGELRLLPCGIFARWSK